MSLLDSLLSRFRAPAPQAALERIAWPRAPAVLYAIGDVHGCLDQLRALEALIADDARDVEGDRHLVLLGDYVDRGPKSAQVIDHLLAPPPPGFGRTCLRGNHDDMLLQAVRTGAGIGDWLSLGGEETLLSYGVPARQVSSLRHERRVVQHRVLQAHVPAEHLRFLEGLPVALEMPGYVFVHAGQRPGRPLLRQSDADLMWIRDPFIASEDDFGAIVVHGHTPVHTPLALPNRIALDTACYHTGRLTACRLAPGEPPRFLQAG